MAERRTDVKVPDLGGAESVSVIEILVAVGDQIQEDDAIVTLEGEKATMDVPSPLAGKVTSIDVKVGDTVEEGHLLLTVEAEGGEARPSEAEAKSSGETGKGASKASSDTKSAEQTKASADQKTETATSATGAPTAPGSAATPAKETKGATSPQTPASTESGRVYAGPAVRRLARELDIDLTVLSGTGHKGRVTKDDIQGYIKSRMQSGGGAGLSIAPMPTVDFSKFGEIETQPLTKIKKFSGANLHRNWVSIPHVTQFDEADMTELEQFRQRHKKAAEAKGFKLTPLVFIMKAVVTALKTHPEFNASLDPKGQQLILKKYFHIGVAVDTPNGLVVPVIRHVDQKGLFDLAAELGTISRKAREKGLTPADMQGGCFTISSLGGIGGTAFTPIINAPEVAILGVSKTQTKPVYDAATQTFQPRLMLPLSLSYDHRVIDGAAGARFIVTLVNTLNDLKTTLL